MKRVSFLCITAVFSVYFSACATIVDGGPQTISISSDPPQASFAVKNMNNGMVIHSGNTPATVMLDRNAGFFKKPVYEITLEKSGFDKQTVLLQGQVTVWYLGGNIIFGGLIGWLVVDPATGAMWKLEPGYVSAMLAPHRRASNTESDATMMFQVSKELSPQEAYDALGPVIAWGN